MAKVTAAHTHGDARFCGASTIVSGQGNVRVNGQLWAVENDQCTHSNGELIPSYANQKVKINGKPVIVVGATAQPDRALHPVPPTDPKDGSGDVFAYTGTTGAGS